MASTGKRINKTVVYKRVEFHSNTGHENLKTMLSKALVKRATIGDRKLNIADQDHPIFHLVGRTQIEPKGFVFGSLILYTPGTDPLFLVDDEQASNITLEKMTAPKTRDGKRREFLESVMYFGVIQNHMIMIQSQALKSSHLETYLQWLLHGASVMAGDNTLHLVDTPSKTVREKINKGKGVKTIKIGGEVLPRTTMPSAALQVADKPSTKSVSVVAKNKDLEWGPLAAIKSLLEPSEAAKIDFDQLTGSNIELTLTLKYNRTTTDDGHKLMDTLGAAFRNTEEVETEIELIDGGSIKGSELKLNGTIKVSSYDGQLSESEVYEGMRQWLLSKVSTDEL